MTSYNNLNGNDTTIFEDPAIRNTLLIGSLIGFFGLFGYAFNVPLVGTRLFFIGFLLAITTFVSGSFIGTLFGMPKRNTAEDTNSTYTLNNSLVEISEWLTKIIVGLGLVNLKQLPGQLMSIGEFVSQATGGKGLGVTVYVNSIVVYFGVFGVFIGYNYMRLVLSQKYKTVDDSMVKIKKELDITKKELDNTKKELDSNKEFVEQKVKETEELQNIVQENKEKTELLINDINEPKLTLEELHSSAETEKSMRFTKEENSDLKVITANMMEKAKERTREGMVFNREDPQKGQWGGTSIRNNRQVSATVKDIVQGLFRINIKLESTDPENYPLFDDEVVLFVLHNSFGDPPVRLVKALNGIAELSLIAYGSFTFGAITDKGKTELELDLVDVPGVSEYFKKH
jgi:uncharacterized membrane-anchored protein YhcB (DUF1043 family)